ncbi:MAG: hypothetical protein ACRDRX_26510 [Pseudonocardiaceae bacterium]
MGTDAHTIAVRYGELSTPQREQLVNLLIAVDALRERALEAAAHQIPAAYGELLATVQPARPARPQRRWAPCPSGLCDHSGELRR